MKYLKRYAPFSINSRPKKKLQRTKRIILYHLIKRKIKSTSLLISERTASNTFQPTFTIFLNLYKDT